MEGKVFKIARLLDGKRQREIAAETGISVSYLSAFECGWRRLPDQQIAKLEKALPKLEKAKTLLD